MLKMGSVVWRVVRRASVHRLAIHALVGLGVLASPVAAMAFNHFDDYTYGQSNCTGAKDPINFYFEGDVGLVAQALSVINGQPVNWSTTPIASDQWMWDSGAAPAEMCHKQDHQRASALTGAKYHTRLRDGSWVANVGWVTAAPMHYDHLIYCGDVAASFNSARNQARDKFNTAGGFVVTRTWVGNTRGFTQCDGRVTASDGYIYRVDR